MHRLQLLLHYKDVVGGSSPSLSTKRKVNMYKIAGTVKYPFGAISPSDSTGHGLGFATREHAQAHADRMNELLVDFDTDPTWSKDFWKTKPEPWVVFEM